MKYSLNLSKWNLLLLVVFFTLNSLAQQANDEVGRKAAQKYFTTDANSKSSFGTNVLMIHLGKFTNSVAYSWGANSPLTDSGAAVYGVTYLFEQWHGFDTNLRIDFHEFVIENQKVMKMSVAPIWTFPRVDTQFPLYFGLGGGLGVFFQQVTGRSYLSFDYQLLMGVRFLNMIQNFGVFLEVGMKNHLHLLSTGQFNGTAVSIGGVFNF